VGSRVLLSVILSLLLIVSLAGCSGTSSTNTSNSSPSAQPAKTVPPDSSTGKPGASSQITASSLTTKVVMVKGSGTVGASTDAKLNFGTSGKIEKIYVNKGDRITNGTLLAKLDTTSLEVALAQAKVALEQAKLAQIQAENSLVSAQYNLDKTKAVAEIKDVMTNIQWNIKVAQVNLTQARAVGDSASTSFLNDYIGSNQAELANQTKKLNALLAKDQYASDAASVSYYRSLVEQQYDRLIVQDVRMKQLAVDIAQQTASKSQNSIDQAQKSLDLTQKQLNDAIIYAPFNGLIAEVPFKEGDFLAAPSLSQKPVIYLIDPTTMEIEVGINELDVSKVKIGQKAVVKIDAFSAATLDGKVNEISPMPDVQGGIVDFAVTVLFNVPQALEIRMGMNGTAEININ
jgi:multidrug resistance efflux pump